MADHVKADGSIRQVHPVGHQHFTLEELHEFVGGYIAMLPLRKDARHNDAGQTMIGYCNEDAWAIDAPLNPVVSLMCGEPIYGDCIIGPEEEMEPPDKEESEDEDGTDG